MPILVTCPGCNRSLRVADALLGQAVKCPECSREFAAPPITAPSDGAETRIQTGPAPARPAERRPIPFEPDFDDDPDDDWDDVRGRRGGHWLIAAAQQRVAGPANGLFAVGVINLLA